MRELNKTENLLFRLGAVLMLVGAMVRLFYSQLSVWIFAVGALLFCVMQVRAEYTGRNLDVRRLRHQQLLGSALLVLTAVCMGMQSYHYGMAQRNEWIISLTVASVLQLYTAWRIPQELDKEKHR